VNILAEWWQHAGNYALTSKEVRLMKTLGFSSLVLSVIMAAAMIGPGPAQAADQPGIVVRGDLEGPDYLQPPQYYKTLQTMLEEARQGPARLGPPPVHLSGTREILVILLQLTDATPDPAHTVAFYQDRFFDTSPPSVRDFYSEVSYGNFTFVPGAVLGWYASTYSTVDWTNDKNVNPGDPDCRDAVREAIQLANADFNFAPYDFNSDGTVTNDELTIFVIVSGAAGGAFHWFAGGVACDGKTVEGEFSTTYESRHIGSYCHELGHDLGLPDLYDTDNGGTGPSEGIGNYGTMGGGSWTFAQMDAWCRIQLGWVTPTIVTVSGFYDVHDLETHPEAYILVDPSHSTTEYFLVENRYPRNSYYEMVGPPVAPSGTYPDSGIVIYHIDDTMAIPWITSGNNNANADETHKTVDVETAAQATSHVIDADDLDATTNRGDDADLWDATAYDFKSGSTPCSGEWYGGGSNHIIVGHFPVVSPTMNVYLSVNNQPPVAACKPFSAPADPSCCITVSVSDIDNGSDDPDGAGDIASLCITAVDGSPVGCEQQVQVCGQGAHSVTLTITDLAGISDACDAAIEVLNTPPVVICKAFAAHGDQNCCITVNVSDIDNGSHDSEGLSGLCITEMDGSPVGCEQSVQVCGQGMHAATLTATDYCGLTSTCTAPVEVLNQSPVAVCQSFSADADSNCCIVVNLTDLDGGTYDPDGPGDIASLGISAVDGTPVGLEQQVQICGVGAHSVTITVTDWCGAASSCDAPVEVIDVTPPEVTVTLNRDALWPPNHKMAEITAVVEAVDNCDPDPEILLVSITSNEPDDGKGDGDFPRDIQQGDIGTLDLAFLLRAERSGGGEGRIYRIIYSATDNSGNVGLDSAFVRVPHDKSGAAFASVGYAAGGTSFDHKLRNFVLVIPSRPPLYGVDAGGNSLLAQNAFDATQIDVGRAYVGNVKGVVPPEKSLVLDNDGDGLLDLALYYSTPAVERLIAASSPQDNSTGGDYPTSPLVLESSIGAPKPDGSYGPVGLHYVGAEGTDYLVADILKLGPPVPLAKIAPKIMTSSKQPGSKAPGQIPETTSLLPIYPNPFSHGATIPFNLAVQGRVMLEVYDVRGVVVATLRDGVLPAGSHQAVWDGRDAKGRHVAGGIYFARLSTASSQTNQKMLLLK
jgi:M6 family metalloprotease-like protein